MTLTTIIGLIVGGLVVGALGRLAVPGRDPMGILATIGVGVAGSLIGGTIGYMIWGTQGPSFLLGVGAAALIVLLIRKIRERRGVA